MIVGAVDDELVAVQREQQVEGWKRTDKLRNPYLHLIAQTVECLVCGYTRDIRLVPELLTTIVLPSVVSRALLWLRSTLLGH